MDPEANLREQRELAAAIILAYNHPTLIPADAYIQATGPVGPPDLESAAARLAELAQALDVWICQGGFLPAAWSRRR